MLNKIFLTVSAVTAVITGILKKSAVFFLWHLLPSFIGSYIACLLLTALFLAAVTLPIDKKKEYDKYNRFYHRLFGLVLELICDVSNVHTTVYGAEKIPGGNFVIVSNHRSRFDPMITYYKLVKYPIAYISKPSNFGIPFGGRLMTKNGFIAINRENPRLALPSIKRAIANIESGEYSIGVYPEGTRNMEGKGLLPFKPGCFNISTRSKAPIVVVTVEGTETVSKRAPFRRTEVALTVCDVLYPENYANTFEISEAVERIMKKELGIGQTVVKSDETELQKK